MLNIYALVKHVRIAEDMEEGEYYIFLISLDRNCTFNFLVSVFFLMLGVNTMLQKEEWFHIVLTTYSCFPVPWKGIHGKTRWKNIDGGNKRNFSGMLVIHLVSVTVCVCVHGPVFMCVRQVSRGYIHFPFSLSALERE